MVGIDGHRAKTGHVDCYTAVDVGEAGGWSVSAAFDCEVNIVAGGVGDEDGDGLPGLGGCVWCYDA